MSDTPYILIVDDEWMNRELLEAYLKMGGYRVGQANNGEKALEMVADQPPALVMLDVRLPGISGFEVCRRLKEAATTSVDPGGDGHGAGLDRRSAANHRCRSRWFYRQAL